jgi:hydrogenase-4 membrane subunit HyfE
MDRFLLFLHVASAIFLLGPLVVVMSATPRYIRTRDVAVLRFLRRSTFVYATGSLAVLVFGLARGRHMLDEVWLSASMTLFIVATVLVYALVYRDQRQAIAKLEENADPKVYERRIVAVGGVVALMYLVILFLMFYHPT